MTTGFTATAFVKMLTRKRDALQSELLLLRSRQDVASYLVQQMVAHLDTANDLLAEAIKLQNAVIAERDFTIKRDGTVDVPSERVTDTGINSGTPSNKGVGPGGSPANLWQAMDLGGE